MRAIQRIAIVMGLALAVAAVTLALLYVAPVWLALAGLFGYMLAIMGWIVSIALDGKRQPVKPSVIVHEDGSYEVLR